MNRPDSILHEQIARFFPEHGNIEAPFPDADLFDAGILDSLTFIDLVVYLEEQFGIRISADELEPQNFRSIAKIAEFTAARAGVKNASSPRAVAA